MAASGVGPAPPHPVPPRHAPPRPGFCREGRRVGWLSRWRRPRGRCHHLSGCQESLPPQPPSPPQPPAPLSANQSRRGPPFLARDSGSRVAECGEGPRRKRWRGRSGHEGGARGEPEGGAEVKDADREAGSPERGREPGRRILGRPRRRSPRPSVGRRAPPTRRLPVSFLPSRGPRGSVLEAGPSFPPLDSRYQGR